MSGAWIESGNQLAALWAEAMERAAWQGGLVLLLAWAACRAWAGMPSGVRCWLWRLAFLKLLLALVWVPSVDLPVLPSAPPAPPALQVVAEPTEHRQPTVSGAPAAPAATAARSPAPVPAPRPSGKAGLLLLWLAGSSVAMAGLWREWRGAREALRSCRAINDPELIAARDRLCRGAGLKRAPELLVSPTATSPWLVGIRRPRIVLPAAVPVGCPPGGRALMLAHELAHLKRQDLLWNWLPALAQALFWFHPLVWLGGQEWRLAQEMACDEAALRLTRAPACDYGEMLLRLAATLPQQRTLGWATVGVLDGYPSLRRRLQAMKQLERPASRRWLIGVVGLIVIGLGLIPWRVVAQAGNRVPERSPTAASSRVFQVVRVTPKAGASPLQRGGELRWHAPREGTAQAVLQRNQVLAGPGDHVEIARGQVFVNGRALLEPRLAKKAPTWRFRHRLGSREYLLVGDHVRGRKVHFTFGTMWEARLVGRAVQPTAPKQGAPTSEESRRDGGGRSELRLRQLATALAMYAQDWDMVLPPMEDAAAVKKALYPYLRRQDAAFLVPGTDEPYQPNPAVSRHQMVGTFRVQNPGQKKPRSWTVRRGQHPRWMKVNGYITDPAGTVAFYEPTPAADGTRGVVFLDGRVARVNQAQWVRLRPGTRDGWEPG